MSVHSTDAFRHAKESVRTEMWSFLSACPILLCRKEEVVLIQLLKKPSWKCRRKLNGIREA